LINTLGTGALAVARSVVLAADARSGIERHYREKQLTPDQVTTSKKHAQHKRQAVTLGRPHPQTHKKADCSAPPSAFQTA
jgi:hypothetical protein